ncbi:hypothetical protein HHK36_026715 [Tetracentron sinense]|uniref:RING-type E3 ubiquitin transferase n=1 Tax=Tetracentron sinense TaxID=13715 RepID=A0A834YFI8_TETSI|nr:hypothetical protein HHK36_026715 [Tetracentron sinense]
MEDFASPLKNPILSSAASEAAEDSCEDACSICLEPFNCGDPATATTCKHEYHLQCILEWSQRSKECPICWQLLVLKDTASQELLAAVEVERKLRTRRRSSNTSTVLRIPPEDFDIHHVAPYTDESDFDERIMQHLAAAATGRTSYFSRRERQRSSGLGPSQVLVFASPANGSDMQQTSPTSPTESENSGSMSSESNSPTALMPSAIKGQSSSPVLSSSVNVGSNITDSRHGPSRHGVLSGQTPPGSPPRRSRPSELLSLSESFKSKFSAASARYKESISKSTRGFKEKLLAQNNSVKELSKEVQREVSAGIAGVARMMERLDLTQKRTGGSDPVSTGTGGTSEFSYNGKSVQENLIAQSTKRNDGLIAHDASSNAPIYGLGTPVNDGQIALGTSSNALMYGSGTPSVPGPPVMLWRLEMEHSTTRLSSGRHYMVTYSREINPSYSEK